MNRQDIPAKSRAENKNQDICEQEMPGQAGTPAIAVMMAPALFSGVQLHGLFAGFIL